MSLDLPCLLLQFCLLKLDFLSSTKNNLLLNWLGGFKNTSRIHSPGLSQFPSQTRTYCRIDWKWPWLTLKLLPESGGTWTFSGWYKHWPVLPRRGRLLKEGALGGFYCPCFSAFSLTILYTHISLNLLHPRALTSTSKLPGQQEHRKYYVVFLIFNIWKCFLPYHFQRIALLEIFQCPV